MASQSILDAKPLQTPHLYINHLPLVDRDFHIKYTASPNNLLKLQCWNKDKFLNQNDDIQLWESNSPKYLFPQVYQFPEIIHLCQLCYFPSQRTIVSPNHQSLFTITTRSINQMLQIHPKPNEAPFSIENLIDPYLKLYLPKRSQILQTFLLEKSQVPTDNPPYFATIFSERARQIVTMLSCILGYITNEHVDEPILSFLSIFCPSKHQL